MSEFYGQSMVEGAPMGNRNAAGSHGGSKHSVDMVDVQQPGGRWQKKVKVGIYRSTGNGQFRSKIYRASVKRSKSVIAAAKKAGFSMTKNSVAITGIRPGSNV